MVAQNFTNTAFLSDVSRTRRSFLEANAPVVIKLDWTICCSDQQDQDVATFHDGNFDHLV